MANIISLKGRMGNMRTCTVGKVMANLCTLFFYPWGPLRM
jgi:hypothetical protein